MAGVFLYVPSTQSEQEPLERFTRVENIANISRHIHRLPPAARHSDSQVHLVALAHSYILLAEQKLDSHKKFTSGSGNTKSLRDASNDAFNDLPHSDAQYGEDT
uniref:AlNc14C242G9496 protein n=1 Tax=Albugo laibachii Nc14 TaxID=890382 RepID=F0WT06_9STRA|nr:AlNc14C242G9496 [Albugo laibachii Nc14]|eukprot:CCA24491.1 AlNc14C242G9496 [Albugo laibachii Nc14]